MSNASSRVLGRTLKDLASATSRRALESFDPGSRLAEGIVLPPSSVPDTEVKTPRVLVISSGKGGTGKSFCTVNLACGLAQLDQRVLLIDADFGLANAHLMLGLNPPYDISHLILGRTPVEEVVQTGPCGVKLLSGCSGISELSVLDAGQFSRFVSEMMRIERDFDWILIDTSAGISPQVMSFLCAALEVLLVINPEATSLLDAYALTKTLFLRHPAVHIGLVANRVKDSIVAKETCKKIGGAVHNYLKKFVQETGFVALDPAVGQSIANRRPVLLDAPQSHAAYCIKKIVQKILESESKGQEIAGESYFVRLQREVHHWQNGRRLR